MTQRISDRPAPDIAGRPGTGARPRALLLRKPLPLRWAWGLALAAALGVALYFLVIEAEAANARFGAAAALTLGALAALLSRRALFAMVLVAALVAIVRAASQLKQAGTEIILHAYDLVGLVVAWPGLDGPWFEHWGREHWGRENWGHVAFLAAIIAIAATLAWVAWRLDATRVRRVHAAGAALGLASLTALAAATTERRHTEFYFESVYVAPFLASWWETLAALRRGHLIEAAARPQTPRLAAPLGCEGAGARPNIILIHQESVVPPSHFPTLGYDRGLDPMFRSFDGRLHKLRVETFGGASWLTEFSLFTGVSANSFGSMRQLVQPVMAGKLGDTLPQALARCGYRNVMFYPMLRTFAGLGRFLESIGLGEIFDARAQGAKLPNERDRFYYASALGEMERHFKASERPLFTFIETMAAHGAYDYAYAPEVAVPGGAPGTHPEMHEYLRRLALSQMDYDVLRAELARRFPGRPFLIMHYGDHQPTAARMLLGFGEAATVEDVMRGGNPAALVTYYAVEGVHYAPPALPQIDTLDIAYLGTVLLEAARLPLSEPYRERRRLMGLCGGRYHDCPARDEILRFHRRLIDAGLMRPL